MLNITQLVITNLFQERKAGMASIKVSRLNLVDLAGSERQKDTHAEGLRLKVHDIIYFSVKIDAVRLIVSKSVSSGFYHFILTPSQDV